MSTTSGSKRETRHGSARSSTKIDNLRLRGILALAEERGLLAGPKTLVVRGRMPADLVAEAKRNSGIASDSKLLEAALANIALEDDYWEWLQSRRGTINPDLDLEF